MLSDAHQRLERPKGLIPLVILIHIEEHDIPALQQPPALANRQEPDEVSDTLADSDPGSYKRLHINCDVDRYVGPLSAFAELYRYTHPQGVYMVGGRIVSPLLLPWILVVLTE